MQRFQHNKSQISWCNRLLIKALIVLLSCQFTSGIWAASRIKDLVDFEGIRENQLVGYGLVVGLNGTGDTLNNIPFTKQSLQAMLERLGVNTRSSTVRTANVAAVMVTGNLPPFATQGTRMDITISALGDAKSLQGGVLLVTSLYGADGEVYSVAQGPIAVGGFAAEGQAASLVRGVPTVGRIANGAIIEREMKYDLSKQRSLRLAIRNPDLTTARRIAITINNFTSVNLATVKDPSTVQLRLPDGYNDNIITLLTEIEQLRVEPDLSAKVVIDEHTGIIVMGKNVQVSTIAIAQGNLTVSITEEPQVEQPQPLTNAPPVILPRTVVNADDNNNKKLAIVKNSVNLKNLVDGLNALGIGPRDMISILQAIKASGALQAEIEVM